MRFGIGEVKNAEKARIMASFEQQFRRQAAHDPSRPASACQVKPIPAVTSTAIKLNLEVTLKLFAKVRVVLGGTQ